MVLRIFVLDQLVYDDGARLIDGGDRFQEQAQQLQLTKALVGEGEGVAEGESGENRPGRFDFAADAPGEGDGDGGDAGRLNDALDQSDGLVADASGGCQQHQVHVVLF